MSKPRRNDNKISVYLEASVLEALTTYTSQTNKSKSLVANDALKIALLSPKSASATSDIQEQLEILREQLLKRDGAQQEAMRLVQEMLGLFIRTYFNYLHEIPEAERVRAAESGRRRFGRFLGVVQDSLEPGKSILEQPIESPKDDANRLEVLNGEI